MLKLFFVLLFSTLYKLCASRLLSLPVFIIDHDNVMSRLTIKANPFTLINGPFFNEIAADAMKRSECVVLFIEDSLSMEDLRLKDKLGTPFYNMHRGLDGSQVIFLPSVLEPYEGLKRVFEPHMSNIFHLRTGERLHVLDQHKYVYVFFKDDGEGNRVEKLRKHDLLMKEVYLTVRLMKGGPVVAFYTGKMNPIAAEILRPAPIRMRTEDDVNKGYLLASPDALFSLTGIYATKQYRRSNMEETPVLVSEVRKGDTLSTTMQYSNLHLQFNFVFGDQYWYLANVALLEEGEEVGRTETNVRVPWRRSYYCNEPINILNLRDGSTFTVSEYQIEPQRTSGRRSDEILDVNNWNILRQGEPFNKSVNCCPYFNSAILSGLLVFFMFVVITAWGVLMLFNCNTGDQYDDPNQKPLVIAAEAGG